MNINPKYLKGSKNSGRRAQLIRQIAEIYKKGKPYPKNLKALMAERDKLQAGGNPYAMPTSAATSGYTSNMSGMAGAQNAALQLQQLQQESVDFQNRVAQTARDRSEQEDAAQVQQIQQDAATLGADEGISAIQAARAGRLIGKIGKGTASAKQVGKAAQSVANATGAGVGQTTIDMLANYGSGADAVQSGVEAGQAATTAGQTASTAGSVGVGPYAALASLAGKGIEHVSDDDNATKTNFGEGFGRGLSGAGSGVGMAAMLGLGPVGLVGAGLVGGYMALRNQRKKKLAAREEEASNELNTARLGVAEQEAFKRSMLTTGQDMGYNIGNSMSNSYLPGYQMMKTGGGPEMIRRADGSYSQRGLWDNIRANKGSGKKPTAKMLKQEKKIKAKKMQPGGTITPDDPRFDRAVQPATAKPVKGKYDPATEAYLDRVDPNRLGMSLQYDNSLEAALTGVAGIGNLAASRGAAQMPKGVKAGLDLVTKGKKIPTAASKSRKPMELPAPLKNGFETDKGLMLKNPDGTVSFFPKGSKLYKEAKEIMGKPMYQKNYPNEMKAGGGYMKPLPGGAVEFVGPKHSKGGIMLDANTEVEGGETMDKVNMKSNGGDASDYIFSDFLKLGKKTFAQRHKEMLARGASQMDIQKLAKMQEEVARKEGRDENGPRDPNNIMEPGGEVNYGGGEGVIPNPDNIDDYELNASGAYAVEFPEGQSETDAGLFGREGKEVTMEDVENMKLSNPWYNFPEDFDPSSEEDVLAFQKAFNERAGRTLVKEDGNLGEQTASAYIPYKAKAAEVAPDAPAKTEEAPAEEAVEPIPPIKLRENMALPYQLMGPLAELNSKYPQPKQVGASPTGRIKLPRVNFNAERAALASQVNSANRYIENNAAGPAAISAKMAMVDSQRQGNIETANAEARVNKDLMAREELANLQASQFDANQTFAARQFNAVAQNQRNQNEYEKRMLAYNQLGTNLAQFSNDMRAYKAEERLAEASQIDNEYTRQKYLEQLRKNARRKKSEYYGMSDTQLREVAARMVEGAPTYNMQNQRRVNALVTAQQAAAANQQTQPTTAKNGGYLSRYGKVKRKKK